MAKYDPNAKPKYDDKPMPIGTYEVEIKDIIADKIGQDSGNTYCSLSFRVLNGDYKGRYIFDNIMYSADWMYKWVFLFNAIGYEMTAGDEINEMTMLDIGEQLKGKVLMIQTKNERYNGVTSAKVYKYITKGNKVKGEETESEETGTDVDTDGFR